MKWIRKLYNKVMSEIIPLTVTLELPASEYVDHDNGPLVRCQKCRRWVPMADYYSEKQGQMLPLVGTAECTHSEISREYTQREDGMLDTEVKHTRVCDWKETVRILEKDETPPEGGTLEIKVHEEVGMSEKFG